VGEPVRPACSGARALDELNGPYGSWDPWLSPDRTELLFTSDRPGTAGWGTWRAVRNGNEGPFGTPMPLMGVNAQTTCGASMSDDGLTLYFSVDNCADGSGPSAVWYATRSDRMSSFFTTQGMLLDDGHHPSLTADGKTLYVSRGLPEHLYRATRTSLSEPFSNPARVDELAYSGEERQPSVSADGTTLVYALTDNVSNLPRIVRAHRGPSTFTSPTAVVEATLPDQDPNASNEHPSLHHDGATIVFSSDVNGATPWRIYIACE
jgi:Tol biopolymer transport system component